MRTWAALVAAFVQLMVAGVAIASPTISLVWSATTGTGTAGSSSIDALPGDMLALDIRINIDDAGFSGALVSLAYDSGQLLGVLGFVASLGTSSEVCPNPPNPGGPDICSGFSSPSVTYIPLSGTSLLAATNSGANSNFGQFDAIKAAPPFALNGTMTLGRAIFQVVGSGTVNVANVPGIDGVVDQYGNVYFPTASASVVLSAPGTCGDGLVTAPETCDDAGVDPGDGCSDACAVEPGFECSGEPSVCIALLPAIEVSPRQYDFGQVDLGTSSAQIVTISNTGDASLVVEDVELLQGVGLGFELTGVLSFPFEIEPNATVDIDLLFAPVDAGAASATLRVASNDPEEPAIEVPLAGFGVSYDAQAMALLTFFEDLVAGGDLVGAGPGNSGSGRLSALRNMIEASGDLIEQGRTAEACEQLEDARRRTDGLFPPPDFASGPAASELETEIAELRSNLRCDVPQATAGCGVGSELVFLLPLLLWLRQHRRSTRA